MVDRGTIHEWIDNFSRDSHPTEEIEIWECAAAVFLEATTETHLSKRYHRQLYKLIFTWISGADRREIIKEASNLPKKIGEHALTAMKSYCKVAGQWEPGFVKEFRKIRVAREAVTPDIENFEGGPSDRIVDVLVERARSR
jgi:hypothetical protein